VTPLTDATDPDGRFGLSEDERDTTGMDGRFVVDPDNPTIHAVSGFPVCIPRQEPKVSLTPPAAMK
jgi:hypothetical protein